MILNRTSLKTSLDTFCSIHDKVKLWLALTFNPLTVNTEATCKAAEPERNRLQYAPASLSEST